MKWIEDVKQRADVWGPIPPCESGGTSKWTSEPLCLQGGVTVEIPQEDFDRLMAIAEGAEHMDGLVTPGSCVLCYEDVFSGVDHDITCPYSDKWVKS